MAKVKVFCQRHREIRTWTGKKLDAQELHSGAIKILLCRLQSIAAHMDHFVQHMSIFVLQWFQRFHILSYFNLDNFILQDLNLNNLNGLIPVRALLCSYKCFNSAGHDYYGVAFPWIHIEWFRKAMKHWLYTCHWVCQISMAHGVYIPSNIIYKMWYVF